MQRIPETPPPILPVPDNLPRLLWSVMIPVYNCSVYLPQAIESVLKQNIGADMMQIEVVDDCSTDADIEELVRIVGKGRVSYYKQQENVGSLRNFETCINRSRGYYIHLLHGDDKVKPGFYCALASLFEKFPKAGAAFCAWDCIDKMNELITTSKKEADQDGILENCLRRLAQGQMLQYVSTVVKREVYENLGSFYAVTYGEDWIMSANIARYYPIAYTPQVFAQYRQHNTSISGQSFLNGTNSRDIEKVSDIISSYLPKNEQHKVRETIRRNYSYWVLQVTYNLWSSTKDKRLVLSQLKQMLKGYKNVKLLLLIGKLLFSVLMDPCKNDSKKTT